VEENGRRVIAWPQETTAVAIQEDPSGMSLLGGSLQGVRSCL
jgi:hypothetical protein